MKRWLARLGGVLILLFLALVVLGLNFLGNQRAAVDWSRIQAVVIESDDWGLSGFVPASDALQGLDVEALEAGRFPEIYWQSTLEDSSSVARLALLLSRFRGRDGLHPVFQPNYIMSALVYEPHRDLELAGTGADDRDAWRLYDLPDLSPAYQRPGLWRAVTDAMALGVWHPELHGRFHFAPDLRREAIHENDVALRAAERGVLIFPGSQRAWEMGSWRDEADLTAELDGALLLFSELFGRSPNSIMAPDYVWDGRCERLWESRGITVIQGKREQRHPYLHGGGWKARLRKVANRIADRYRHPGRVYLERNCRLESAQTGDWQGVTQDCLDEVQRAWRRGEPAIIETHRVNYVHCDSTVAATGFQALENLLKKLTEGGGSAPLFLTDHEVAQLQRTGTSWAIRRGSLVVRNYTDSRRLVAIPDLIAVSGEFGPLVQLGDGPARMMATEPWTTQILPGQWR